MKNEFGQEVCDNCHKKPYSGDKVEIWKLTVGIKQIAFCKDCLKELHELTGKIFEKV